jgi:hypothetical protein
MTGRRIEGNFSQGWGVAAFITLLALGAYFTAFAINRHSNRSPNDVLTPVPSAESH